MAMSSKYKDRGGLGMCVCVHLLQLHCILDLQAVVVAGYKFIPLNKQLFLFEFLLFFCFFTSEMGRLTVPIPSIGKG